MAKSGDARSLLDGLTEAAVIAADGRIAAANEPARSLLGRSIQGAELGDVISHPAAL
jgi:hypothetical protein